MLAVATPSRAFCCLFSAVFTPTLVYLCTDSKTFNTENTLQHTNKPLTTADFILQHVVLKLSAFSAEACDVNVSTGIFKLHRSSQTLCSPLIPGSEHEGGIVGHVTTPVSIISSSFWIVSLQPAPSPHL